MGSLEGIRDSENPTKLVASILAIGTANPPMCLKQADFPDFYFRVTKSQHFAHMKEKFHVICQKTMVKQRYIALTEEVLEANPNLSTYMSPSLDTRQEIAIQHVSKLGTQAALEAIKEWGRPKSDITHLIVCTYSALKMPGMDMHIAKELGLQPSVKRTMLYLLGCYGGGTVLRLAKDIAENNNGSRVLVVCSEVTAIFFRGPPGDDDKKIDMMVEQTLFGDGAAAAIVGAHDNTDNALSSHAAGECPLFQLISASQRFIPGTEDAMSARVCEAGETLHLSKDIPMLIAKNIEDSLVQAFSPLGVSDWNSIFWVSHPGGPAILSLIQAKLGLTNKKLEASWHVLSEYGNMSSPTVLFILNEMRKRSFKDGDTTTGQGHDLGVLFGFGPGLTIETIVLRSVPL